MANISSVPATCQALLSSILFILSHLILKTYEVGVIIIAHWALLLLMGNAYW